MITVVVVVVAKNCLLQRFFVSRLGFQILNRAETRRLTRRVREDRRIRIVSGAQELVYSVPT